MNAEASFAGSGVGVLEESAMLGYDVSKAPLADQGNI